MNSFFTRSTKFKKSNISHFNKPSIHIFFRNMSVTKFAQMNIENTHNFSIEKFDISIIDINKTSTSITKTIFITFEEIIGIKIYLFAHFGINNFKKSLA